MTEQGLDIIQNLILFNINTIMPYYPIIYIQATWVFQWNRYSNEICPLLWSRLHLRNFSNCSLQIPML